MRKLLTLIIFFCLIGVTTKQVRAIYDPLSVPNNKFGIHILDTSEIEKAREFVNSDGGEYGYVTIPIRANDRDLDKWTKFMVQSKQLKIIPILRIASFPVDDHWMAPNEYDLLDFANFLDQLPWPTKNRYVIIYNEPNQEGEWGGFIDPVEYAHVLDRAIDLFREVNSDFFIISAGLDASQNNVYNYLWSMEQAVPRIFDKVDGLAFHAYGNPGFTTPPNIYSRVNVASFRYELKYLRVNKPIFLTEAGWKNPLDWYFINAFTYAWNDVNIVAVTPFLLNGADGPFRDFSFVDEKLNYKDFAQKIMAMPKTAGRPLLAESRILNLESEIKTDSGRGQNDTVELNFFEKLIEFLHNLFL